MTDLIIEILEYSSESQSVDFKKCQYEVGKDSKKHELLKDIIAMANHPSNEDKYIIVGVKAINGRASEFFNIDYLTDQATYQQFINSYIEPEINFEYNSFTYKKKQLAYFRIFNNNDRPYLIKKIVKNFSEANKIEFREGDGFIRVGTSTKKLTRKEFDNIYKLRLKKKDRKSDIKIIPTVANYDTEINSEINIKRIDISIENTSNQSIEVDVEIKLFKNDNLTILSESEFEKERNKVRNEQTSSIFMTPVFESPILGPNFERKDNYILVSSLFVNSLKIKQKSIEEDYFSKSILVLKEDNLTYKVNAEVIIRSDDFSEGLLKENVEFVIE